jgi:type VI protein secretion system component Hcp
MPKAKGRKAAAKHLHKGKKLEATKPLRSGKGSTEYLKVNLDNVLISGIQNS